jgi:small subunit ribosomal protein S17
MSEMQATVERKAAKPRHHRQEMVGVVSSNRMTRTVVVTVDRRVRHPLYGRVVRRRSKFMAHDEVGCSIGDKVRLISTRPVSAKKRWRVVEIIQRTTRRIEAEKVTAEVEAGPVVAEVEPVVDSGVTEPAAGAEVEGGES